MKNKNKLNPNALKWVKALKSKKYKQCKGALHKVEDSKHTYCCLGVACEVAKKNGVELTETVITEFGGQLVSYNKESGILPAKVRQWLGLRTKSGEYNDIDLTELNDGGKSFKQIAKLIESKPEGLFVKNEE